MSAIIDKPFADYQRLSGDLPGHDMSWLRSLREEALRGFMERGYPTQRDEAWKYTNVMPVIKKAFEPVATAGGAEADLDLAPWLFPEAAMTRLVFVDGHFSAKLSAFSGLPNGVTIGSLGEALQQAPAELEPFLSNHSATTQPDAFAELNTAFMTDGAYIRIPPGVTLEQPIHVLHIAGGHGRPVASYLRNFVLGGKGSSAIVIEHHVSLDGAEALVNTVTRCALEEGAALEHYILNEQGDGVYHFAGIHVDQSVDSRYASHNMQSGSRLARSDFRAVLAGEGSACTMNGLYFGQGRQHIDNHTCIDHQAPHCTSRELYKGVLDGKSSGVFTGRVVVRQDAQQTDAGQTNHNLLLSDDAEANSRPQLEIYADDVKCSHGSTVGQLNRDALFYLRARGIEEQRARNMLVSAFADDVLQAITLAPVRRRIERLVAERMGPA